LSGDAHHRGSNLCLKRAVTWSAAAMLPHFTPWLALNLGEKHNDMLKRALVPSMELGY